MSELNSGYIALAIGGIIFLGVQVWWIGMTFKNGQNERVQLKIVKTDEIKRQLEKIFIKAP